MSFSNRVLSIGSLMSAAVAGSLLHPIITGQVSHTTNQGASIGGGLLPSATVFIAISLILGLIAYRHHIPLYQRHAPSKTTVASLAFSGLLLSAVVIGAGTSPAQAQTDGFQVNDECDALDLIITGSTLGIADLLRDHNEKCLQKPTDPNDLAGVDALAAGEKANTSTAQYNEQFQNFGQDRMSILMARGVTEANSEISSGANESVALKAATDAVNETVAQQQKDLISRYSSDTAYYAYLANTSASVQWGDRDLTGGTQNQTFTLADGSTYYGVEVEYMSQYNGYITWDHPDFLVIHDTSGDNLIPSNDETVTVSYDGNTTVMYTSGSYGSYESSMGQLRQDYEQSQANLETYVSQTHAAYVNGTINDTDLATSNPLGLAQDAATSYNSTGFYSYSNAQLASLGLDGDLNASHSVTLEETNRTVNGTLFYTGSDNQTFSTGTTYNPDDLDGTVYMTVASISDSNGTIENSSRWHHVDENFTIQQATNVLTGESMSNTTMEQRNYTTTDPTQLNSVLQELAEIREYMENDAAAVGSGSGQSRTSLVLIAAALVAGAALMGRREQN